MKSGRIEIHVLRPAEDNEQRDHVSLWMPVSSQQDFADAIGRAIDFMLEQADEIGDPS